MEYKFFIHKNDIYTTPEKEKLSINYAHVVTRRSDQGTSILTFSFKKLQINSQSSLQHPRHRKN